MKIPKQITLRKAAITVLITVLLTSLCFYFVYAIAPSTSFTISGGIYPGAPEYTVWNEGIYYFAKDANGNIDYTGTNRHTVVQSCIDALTEGIIAVRGFVISYYAITLTESVTIYEYYKGRTRKFIKFGGNTYSFVEEHFMLGDNRKGIPKWTTRGACTNVLLHDSYFILCARKDIAGGTAGQVYFAGEFLYGTYQWNAKLLHAAPTEGSWNIFFGFCEEFSSQYEDSIFVEYNGSAWIFKTRNGGSSETTDITGVTWTNENTFKVNWTSTSVKLYVNDVLKADHTTQVPTKASIAFLEIISSDATTNNVYIYTRDWEKIA